MRNVTKRTSDRRQVRSERALPRINTHDIQSSRLATLLEKDIPAGELHQRKSAYMREKRDGLFNSRAAGRSQKHACHENVDESPVYSRAQYTPKRDGGDGNYRQLNYYKQHAKRILRKTCLKNARARGTLPSKRSLDKYQFTADELRGLA